MKINFISARDRLRTLAAVSAVVLMSGAGSAWASVDVSGENNTTGFNSTNDNSYDIADSVDLTVDNTSAVSNTPSVTANSGGNDVNNNTTVDDVMGGDIDVEGEFTNELNSADMDLSMDSLGDVSADFTNDTTGSNSDNTNELDVTRDMDIDVTNSAAISNDIDADLNSGDNRTNNNTTVGDVSTGDIDFSVDVENKANQNAGSIRLPDMGNTDVNGDFTNDTTGANSDNSNTVTVDDSADIDITNSASVSNNLDINGDSGHNDVNRNTTVGNVKTGDQKYNFTFTNILN